MKTITKSILFLLFLSACTKPIETVSNNALKTYEGLYEYYHDTQLKIASTPKDSTLIYAIIDEAKYPLRLVGEDTFLNVSNQSVVFCRNEKQEIIGYREGGDGAGRIFRLLDNSLDFPKAMWYPRLEKGEYRYQVPSQLEDGIEVAHLEQTPLNPQLIEEMVKAIINEEFKDVHSVLIFIDGKLVVEEYFYEYDRDTPHQLRSATKSVMSILTGLALDNECFNSINEPVYPFFDNYSSFRNPSSVKDSITLKHLLTQSSGLDCNDWDWESAGNEQKMYQQEDWIRFILDLPSKYSPGSEPQYCSGGVNVLGRVIEKTSKKELLDFADTHLFEPLGITNYEWNFTLRKKNAATFAQLYMRPRDLGKLLMMLDNKGTWKGKQVVSQQWMEESIETHSMLDNTEYGYLWWKPYLNVGAKKHEAILATGNGGQKAYLWKDLNMITIFTGGNYNKNSKVKDLLVDYILPAF